MAHFKIVVWAIIFLTKLRFTPGISIATVLNKTKSVSIYNVMYYMVSDVMSSID